VAGDASNARGPSSEGPRSGQRLVSPKSEPSAFESGSFVRAHGEGPISASSAPRPLSEIIAREQELVRRILRRNGVDDASLDDAVQCVWIVISRRLGDVPTEQERSFVFGTALRVASEWRRSHGRHQGRTVELPVDLRDRSPSPPELLETRRALARLREALERLPDDLRTVVALFDLEERTAADVARALGIPVGTVASRVRRARAFLRELLPRR
jgi:RNA polymerase sigma-70 factor (ECF subfamily)